MDEHLARQLVRQLKIINIWISFLGIIFILSMITIGILLWQIVGFVRQTDQQIQSLRQNVSQSVDLKSQACLGDNAVSNFLRSQSDYCDGYSAQSN